MCVCVCVCEREREREEGNIPCNIDPQIHTSRYYSKREKQNTCSWDQKINKKANISVDKK